MLIKFIKKYKLDKAVGYISRYKFVITLLTFIVWMIFFDRINIVNQYSLHQTREKLESEQQYFKEEIRKSKELHTEIQSNLEKFAREKYFMHKSDEDIYVFK